ncbi:hypothetical protein LWI29_037185 [Acer saccharum]|uniref:Glycosyltransferase 61 catalytic domain-containing protein n=1 Tax=Acer saccharum TaxID=4024 RepID=A0AA39RSH7_ACESA|nr:hypothetical protein LWI29_037185 [Acer saccharum]
MEILSSTKALNKQKNSRHLSKLVISILLLFVILILLHLQASPINSSYSPASASRAFFTKWKGLVTDASSGITLISRLRDSVTFLPLKDLRFAETAMEGNTWFMSSLNDTREENEAEHLYFPSQASKGRLLCIMGRDKADGTKNSYALAWPETLPNSATLLKGLTFVSDTYYDYKNLWHGLCAMAPFVGWSIKNGCLMPDRWVLFHWGELRDRMGSWLHQLMETNFGGEVEVEGFERDGPYCFERAVVMRHNLGSLGKARKLEIFDSLRCKARRFCSLNPAGKGLEVNERGKPIIRLTLLMRRGSRSFKNPTAVIQIFAKECARIEGCILSVSQSEDLRFCDQVRVMTNTDVIASPHGAQLTNMLFMDQNSSVMEFFPRGWFELAGVGQYAHHWMADQSGMRHQGAWWDPLGEKECPSPQHDRECFNFYKDGQVGHNETFFAEWARSVLNQVRISKREQVAKNPITTPEANSGACVC